ALLAANGPTRTLAHTYAQTWRARMSLEHSPDREGARTVGHSYTVAEFCKAERISRSMLYWLWKHGIGPQYYNVGSHRRITESRQRFHRQAEARAAAPASIAPCDPGTGAGRRRT